MTQHSCVYVKRKEEAPAAELWIYGVTGCLYYNVPGVRLYGGSILPGDHNTKPGCCLGLVFPGFGVATAVATTSPIS